MVSTISVNLSRSFEHSAFGASAEGAGGHELSYLGYVEVVITCRDIDMENLLVNMLILYQIQHTKSGRVF